MSLANFNRAFGIEANLDEEKKRFVHRINQSALTFLNGRVLYPDEREAVFRSVCYDLGIDPNPLIEEENYSNYGYDRFIPSFQVLTRDDFFETLKVLVLARQALSGPENIHAIDASINLALAAAVVDLNVRWKDGMFYPSGAKELDEKLVDDNLTWLHSFPEVRKMYGTALEHFGKSLTDSASRKDAITNAYSAIEGLARQIIGNEKSFEDNSNNIVSYIGLPKEYGNILHYYKQIAHEYSSRHAGSEFSHVETEAFIYLTGLLMRLISEKASS